MRHSTPTRVVALQICSVISGLLRVLAT